MLLKRDNMFLNYLSELPNYFSIFTYSFFLMLASPILLEISNSFKTNPGNISLIFTFFTIGVTVGQLTAVFYSIRFKKINIIIISYIMLILLISILFFIKILFVFFILYFISGYVIGIIFIVANEFLLLSKIKNKDRLITIGHTFWPLGALIGPVISSTIVGRNINWRYIYLIIIFFIVIILLLYLMLTRKKDYSEIAEKKTSVSLKEIFSIKRNNIIFILMVFSLLFYAISETVISAWSPTFLRVERLFDVETAGILISLFWGAQIIGRIITSIFAGRIRTNLLLLILAITALLSLFLLIFFKNQSIIFTAFIIAGLGYSGISPLIISTGANVCDKGKGVLLTILVTFGALGLSMSPYITRVISKFSMVLSMSVSIIFMAILIVIIFIRFFNKKYLEF